MLLGPGAIIGGVLLVIAATTDVDLTPIILFNAGVEGAAFAGIVLLLRTSLIVQVSTEGVHIRVPHRFGEDIPAAEVVAVEEVSSGLRWLYDAGFGKRYGDRRARYTTGDDAGVVVKRSNGWRIVIGSKRSGELADAIRTLTKPRHCD